MRMKITKRWEYKDFDNATLICTRDNNWYLCKCIPDEFMEIGKYTTVWCALLDDCELTLMDYLGANLRADLWHDLRENEHKRDIVSLHTWKMSFNEDDVDLITKLRTPDDH